MTYNLREDIEKIGGKICLVMSEKPVAPEAYEFSYNKKRWWISKDKDISIKPYKIKYAIQSKKDGMAGSAVFDWIEPNSKSLKDYLNSCARLPQAKNTGDKELFIEIKIKLDERWLELLEKHELTEEEIKERVKKELAEQLAEVPITISNKDNLKNLLSPVGEIESMEISHWFKGK